MLGDTIKKLRKKQGISQEELALKMHVVRQTISKWENGLSVPDAEELIRLSEVLQVSVGELLNIGSQTRIVHLEQEGIKSECVENEQLENYHIKEEVAKELAELTRELAERKERERTLVEAGKVRGYILMLAFAAVVLSFIVKNAVGAIVVTAICCVAALIILYNNLGLLTAVTTDDLKLKPLKITTIFNITMITVCAAIALLVQIDFIKISENGEKFTAALIVSLIIFFTGYIAPKLPFNRHTGMRLPWTVADEETWNVAHQVLGAITVPVGIVYIGLVPFIENFEVLTCATVFLWIGIPGVISLIYFWRKFHR